MVTGINPLRCFIYKEGLARFATEPYQSPMGSNLNNLQMHLTNYAINKEAEGFIQNEDEDKADVGHKRSLTSILNHIDINRKSINDKTGEEVWDEIKQICVKTLMAGIHPINHLFKSSKPQDNENSLCFQILGIDIFLDSNCKSWLIEVNQSPSFLTDSPLDYQVKKNLLRDTLHILNLTWKRKNRCISQAKNEMASRLIGKQRLNQQEREALKQKKQRIKDKFEFNNMGDFQNLYPLRRDMIPRHDELMDIYENIYRKSREVYEDTTQGGYNNKVSRKEETEKTPTEQKKQPLQIEKDMSTSSAHHNSKSKLKRKCSANKKCDLLISQIQAIQQSHNVVLQKPKEFPGPKYSRKLEEKKGKMSSTFQKASMHQENKSTSSQKLVKIDEMYRKDNKPQT